MKYHETTQAIRQKYASRLTRTWVISQRKASEGYQITKKFEKIKRDTTPKRQRPQKGEVMCGINSAEFFVILFVGLIVAGPGGLRTAFQSFRSFVTWAKGISARLRSSTPELRDTIPNNGNTRIDLNQYNPSEIIRQAVHEETQAWIRQLEGREKHT